MRVYLAGPITGLTWEQATTWRQYVAQKLPARYEILDPMRGKEHLADKGPLPNTFDDGIAAVEQDLADIDQADIVLVNFTVEGRASLGTMAEIGYAFGRGVWPVILVALGDGNPHDHVFVHYMADKIVSNLGDAIKFLETWTYDGSPALAA